MMLKRQHGRGGEHRHLLVFLDHFEGRSHGHLCFTVSHIAAKEPVHRLAALEIALNLLDDSNLVGCFLKLEGSFKLPLPVGIGRKGPGRCHLPLGV